MIQQKRLALFGFGLLTLIIVVQGVTVAAFYERGKLIDSMRSELAIAQKFIHTNQAKQVPFSANGSTIVEQSQQSEQIEHFQTQLRAMNERVDELNLKLSGIAGGSRVEVFSTPNTFAQAESDALVQTLVNQGYMDDETWNHHRDQVSAMSKEANKQFWSKMFASIEAGEINLVAPTD